MSVARIHACMYAYMHICTYAYAYTYAPQVDAERDLPSGELVIGLNPPFGHQNRIAIDFVEHALCARPAVLSPRGCNPVH